MSRPNWLICHSTKPPLCNEQQLWSGQESRIIYIDESCANEMKGWDLTSEYHVNRHENHQHMDLKDGLESERPCLLRPTEVLVMLEHMGEERGDHLALGTHHVLLVRRQRVVREGGVLGRLLPQLLLNYQLICKPGKPFIKRLFQCDSVPVFVPHDRFLL